MRLADPSPPHLYKVGGASLIPHLLSFWSPSSCRECSLSLVLQWLAFLVPQVVFSSMFQQRFPVVDSSLLKLATCVLAQPESLHLPLHLSYGSASSLYEGSCSHLA